MRSVHSYFNLFPDIRYVGWLKVEAEVVEVVVLVVVLVIVMMMMEKMLIMSNTTSNCTDMQQKHQSRRKIKLFDKA